VVCSSRVRYRNRRPAAGRTDRLRSVDGKSHAGLVSFTPLDPGNTRVSVRFEWAPETFTEKAGAALKIDEMQVKADLRKFKTFIESRGTETGAWRGDVEDSGPTGQI
jgi:uncharacterized membrane protein